MFRLALAAALLLGGLTACGSDSGEKPTATASSSPTAEVPVSAEARRETIYLEATAAHLCAVQSRVYTDPAEMAAAYASKPEYVELTPAEVTAFDERAKADP